MDIVHPDQAAAGTLAGYQHLVVPTHSLYDLGDNAALEAAVKEFVVDGGTMFHGPQCELARRALGVAEEVMAFDCIKWREEIIPHGWSTVAFRGGKTVGAYIQSGKAAIAQTEFRKGKVYSFGFQYGHADSRRTMPIVPPQYGKREIHPIVLLKETPVAALAGISSLLSMLPVKNAEFARFGKKLIIVNHRSSPVDIGRIPAKRLLPLLQSAPGWLAAHSAAYVEF